MLPLRKQIRKRNYQTEWRHWERDCDRRLFALHTGQARRSGDCMPRDRHALSVAVIESHLSHFGSTPRPR